jgi:hypothetical protein
MYSFKKRRHHLPPNHPPCQTVGYFIETSAKVWWHAAPAFKDARGYAGSATPHTTHQSSTDLSTALSDPLLL